MAPVGTTDLPNSVKDKLQSKFPRLSTQPKYTRDNIQQQSPFRPTFNNSMPQSHISIETQDNISKLIKVEADVQQFLQPHELKDYRGRNL